jgi:hypothetical protein
MTWEVNGAYDNAKQLPEASPPRQPSAAPGDWEARLSNLRTMYDTREQQVQRLQEEVQQQAEDLDQLRSQLSAAEGEVADAAGQLTEAEAELGAQAALLEAQQAQISSLAQQLESAGQTHALLTPARQHGMESKAQDDGSGGAACYVQLPPESYPELQPGCCGDGGGAPGCCWWQCLGESCQEHPKRWAWAGVAAALLLVLLCATIIPTAHRNPAPRFTAAPALAAPGPSWVDLTVALDRPGVVSYLVVPTARMGETVAGTGSSLLALLQRGRVPGAVIYSASATSEALQSAGGEAVGLEQMAVACGWAAVGIARQNTTVSIVSVPGSAAAACAAPSNRAPHSGCGRCPRLEDGTAYTVLLAAAPPRGGHYSQVQAVAVQTGAAPGFITSTNPPYVVATNATAFEVHFQLRVPGTVRYAVQYAGTYVPYNQYELYFASLPPADGILRSLDPSAFAGGIVAAGELPVEAAGAWAVAELQPACVAGLCSLSMFALQPNTSYQARHSHHGLLCLCCAHLRSC